MLRIIAAIGKNREIGKNNKLLWDIKEELNHFKSLTLNTTIIMGKNTFYSIGRLLPDRTTIVISEEKIEGVKTYDNIDLCFRENPNANIIGGQSIFEQSLDYVEELHLSIINKSYKDADAYFPEFLDKFYLSNTVKKKDFEYRIYRKKGV